MQRKINLTLILVVIAATLVIAPWLGISRDTAMAKTESKTLANLQAAFNGESNARSRYLAFAEKADKEGYGQVASLFRAAAKSEEIHMGNYSKLIKKMKAEPKATIEKPVVKSTKENLEFVVKGESKEVEEMYPEFVKQAEAEKNKAAAMTFHGALETEEGHDALFKEALSNMEKWKKGKKEFLVCLVCGYTTTNMAIKVCPVCSSPREKFVSVK